MEHRGSNPRNRDAAVPPRSHQDCHALCRWTMNMVWNDELNMSPESDCKTRPIKCWKVQEERYEWRHIKLLMSQHPNYRSQHTNHPQVAIPPIIISEPALKSQIWWSMVKTKRRSLVFIYVCPSLLSSLLRLCSFTSLLSSLLCSLHFRTLHFCTCFTYSMYVIHFSLPSSLLSALPCSSLLYVLTVLQITTEFRLPNFLC